MAHTSFRALAVVASVALAACGSSSPSHSAANDAGGGSPDTGTSPDASMSVDASAPDAADAADAGIDKSKPCVSTFGQAIGSVGFARFDGTVIAVLPPGNKTCTAPNTTHLVLELAFSGAAYRMVVDVDDTASVGTIRAHTITHDLVGGAWSDGWHTVPLDYVTTLGLHGSDFVSEPTADAVAAITKALDLGAHVSVFATAQGENDSAHLVHRNLANQDGAIVIDVDGASPTWLLFAFSNQSF